MLIETAKSDKISDIGEYPFKVIVFSSITLGYAPYFADPVLAMLLVCNVS